MRAHGCGGGVSTRPLVSGIFFLFVTRPLRCPGGAWDPVILRLPITTLRCSLALFCLAISPPFASKGRWSPVRRQEALQSGDIDQSNLVAGATEWDMSGGRRTALPVRMLVTARLEGHARG